MKHYFQSLFNENLTFVLGWEAFVLFMLLMFISIIIRLNRIEKKLEANNDNTWTNWMDHTSVYVGGFYVGCFHVCILFHISVLCYKGL